jgi:hypothetical protein
MPWYRDVVSGFLKNLLLISAALVVLDMLFRSQGFFNRTPLQLAASVGLALAVAFVLSALMAMVNLLFGGRSDTDEQ